MKHSIKKIFRNLSFFLLAVSIFAGLAILATIDHLNSYKKIDNLNNQKEIISSLTNLPKDNLELMFIELNGKSKQLHIEIDKLRTLYDYNFAEKYILLNSKEYLSDLDKLNSLTTAFNKEAYVHYYYEKESKSETTTKEELEKKASSLVKQIDSIIFKDITYSQRKFNIHKNATFLVFIITLLGFIWYKKRLDMIYKDLQFLFHVNHKKHTIFSQEVGAISVRMNRKSMAVDNPILLDPVTGINNIKGLMSAYSEKKGMKEDNFTSVSVLEIDNFSKTNRVYSQELTQAILKKIAFTMSLHEQVADVISRTDYNQFTIILSRPKKEDSFKEIENIRKSISELKLSSAELGEINITVSGGYVIKPNNVSLEESIRQAKKVLLHAQKSGKNKISQIKDLAQSEL
ncbi:MAG: GGDEF domain-containing protein [Sulfurimonas sp.]|uniref:GGDEF domain-containing protein n=1 Tax=Sulfurimonas sp. TaxID=2022749 RepID=UPI002616CEEA|nr:GGDEF domain-containing protein [Sulfurimonas sp.]MDD5401354.1 GGDEF domain-containing protein [Sulfurimonas sp.]